MANEHAVMADADLAQGQLKAVQVGDVKVLLSRDGGRVFAMGAVCPHYKLPLADGMVCGGRLHCPWHQSQFELASGGVVEPPALDGLATYRVRVDAGQVYVTLDDRPAHRPPAAGATTATDARTFVVLGGGAAGNASAEALRELGFAGRVLLVTADPRPPYDRPNLSKKYLSGDLPGVDLPLRPAGYYADRGITLLPGRAAGLDPAGRRLSFTDGSAVAYDKLLLAVGSVPKTLDVGGHDLAGVLTLRSRDDADRIITAVGTGKRVVVVGSSFIGMEVAAALTQRGSSVTVVTPAAAPFAQVLGPDVGDVFRRLHETKGVGFRLAARVAELTGDGHVRGVRLADGDHLDADLVVVGVGVRPATDFLPESLRDPHDGGVPVDEHLVVPGTGGTLLAVGDIARVPDWLNGDAPARIEHWRLAEQHGRLAAANMVGPAAAFRKVPYFWTNQFGKSLDYVGYAARWDAVVIDGNLAAGQFLAYYLQGDRIAAAAGLGRKRDVMALMELMARGGRQPAAGVRAGAVDWPAELAAAGRATPVVG